MAKLCPAKIRFVPRAKTPANALRIQIIKELATKQQYTVNGFWNRQLCIIASTIGLLINTLSGAAQNFCPNPASTETGGFSVPTQVCAGKPLTVTNPLPGLLNVRYTYQYDGNGIPAGSSSPTTTYTAPGSYTILQVAAGSSATGTFACRVVEVLPVDPVAFTLTACGNLSATLRYVLDSRTIKYNTLTINWGDGRPVTNVVLNGAATTGTIPYTYLTPGNRTVTVTGAYTDACAGTSATKPISIQSAAAINPVIRALTSGETAATIDYQGPTGYTVELLQKNGSGTYAPTGLTGTAGTFSVPASPSQVSCFQLVAKDGCGTSERRSTEVCSLVIKAEAGDGKNTLEWQPYAGVGGTFVRYFVYKDGPPTFSTNSRLVSSYADMANIICGKRYCYLLEATINNPSTSSQTTVRSLPACVTGINNATIVSPVSAYVSVQSGGVSVQATLPSVDLPTPYSVVVTRSSGNGSAFDPLATITDGTYLDASAQTGSQSYCYQTAIRNNCGVLSKPTAPACSILLTRSPNGDLTWTSASPYSNGPPQEYLLIFIDPATGNSDKQSIGVTTAFKPDPNTLVTQYQIAAVNGAGVESYSNPIEVELGLRVFLPNAFTPNGSNPSFMAKGLVAFWETFELTVFSRWGDVVFNSTDKNTTGWNGDVNGVPATPGHYGYRIRVTDANGKAFDRTGQVLLIR